MAREEQKQKKEPRYYVKEVATQVQDVIVDADLTDDKGENMQYNMSSALVKIMNDIEELKQGLL